MTVQSGELETRTLQAGANLSNSRFRFVRISAENLVDIASNASANTAFGVLMNDPSSGQAARICVGGAPKVYAGGTVTAGQLVTHTSSGSVLNATSGQLVVGRALSTGVAGDLVQIDLAKPFFAAVGV